MSNFRVDDSAQSAVAVTPSDTVNIAHPVGNTFTKKIFFTSTANLSVVMADGTTATFTGLLGGVLHDLSVARVNATGTNATGIIALY